MLIQILDEELDPTLSASTTNVDTQKKRRMLYQLKFTKPLSSNPVVSEVSTRQLDRGYKILWKKVYKLREQRSTEDELQHKLVKLFRQVNKVKKFQESPDLTNVDVNNADNVDYNEAEEAPSTMPTHSKDNLFLVIVSNKSAEDQSASYDINIKQKYTLIGNIGS